MLVASDGVTHDVSEFLLVLVIVLTCHTSGGFILSISLSLLHVASGQKGLSCVAQMVEITNRRSFTGVGCQVSGDRVSDFA